MTGLQGSTIIALMKESQQMLSLIKFCGYYMLLLTLIYLGLTIYQLVNLDANDFIGMFVSHPYDYEVYLYSEKIEYMKVVHAISLACIGVFLVHFTRKFKVLNESHYYQILGLTVLVTIIYIFPVIYIAYISYKDASLSFLGYHAYLANTERPQWEIAITKFVDWLIMIIYRSDFGLFGFVCSLLVHLQIYILLFVMQCCAAQVDDIQKRIHRQREQDRGSYNGVELSGGIVTTTSRTANTYTLSDGSEVSASAHEDINLLNMVGKDDPEINHKKKLKGGHYLEEPENYQSQM
jgi:hypothetical protein